MAILYSHARSLASPSKLSRAAPRAQERLLQRVLGLLEGPEHPVAVHVQLAPVALERPARSSGRHVVGHSAHALLTPARARTHRSVVARAPARVVRTQLTMDELTVGADVRRSPDPRDRGARRDGHGLPGAPSQARPRRRAEGDRPRAERGPRVPDPLPARVRGRGLDPPPERRARLRRGREGRAAVRDDAVRRGLRPRVAAQARARSRRRSRRG